MTAGAVVVRRQVHYLRTFHAAFATSPATAKTLGQIGCSDSLVFRGLVRRGVIVACPGERFYLDPGLAREFMARRRRKTVFLVGAGIVLVVVLANVL